MCFSIFSITNKTKVELNNGNWREIERVEVNLDDNEKPNLVEEIEDDNAAIQKKNGDLLTEVTEAANGESKDFKEPLERIKVWFVCC